MELLGAMPDVLKFFIVFVLMLGLLVPLLWLWRRFNVGSFGHAGQRNRQSRLSVVEATPVDLRHRLVLVKRDNVEHLLLVGGTANIVVESNIARSGAPMREPRPIPDARPETARQQPPEAETPDWSLPLEPMPMGRPVHTIDLDAALPEPPARTAREAMVDSMRAVRSVAAARRGPPPDLDNPPEEVAAPALSPAPPPAEVNLRPEPLRRAAPPPERLQPAPAERVPPSSNDDAPPEPPRREQRAPQPQRPVQPAPPAPAGNVPPPPLRPVQPAAASGAPRPPQASPAPARPTPSDEGNFAEMAQRLEAALRRPAPARPEPPQPPARPPLRQEQPTAAGRRQPPPPPDHPAGPSKVSVKAPDPAPPPDLKVLPGKGKNEAAMDSLEDEMARMLGRPGKS